MKCGINNKPNGWSDLTFNNAYDAAIKFCKNEGFAMNHALDIGCRGGTITNILDNNFHPKHIYGFEPTPESFNDVATRYKSQEKVKLFQVACSNFDGTATFYTKPDKPSGNSLRPAKDRTLVEVQTVRLDTWAKQNNVPSLDVVKIDVEGHEIEVLEGMGDLLFSVNILLAEVRFVDRPTLYHKLANFLEPYKLQLFSIVGLYYQEERISWGDVIFVRNKG
jgi:FkbM family methyltransferase